MTLQIINKTPHTLNILSGVLAPTLPAARCSEVTLKQGEFLGIPLISKKLGDIVDLPERTPETAFIVSLLVATRAWDIGRTDVLAIGETTRDAAGKITGCISLATSPQGLQVTDSFGNLYNPNGEPVDGE